MASTYTRPRSPFIHIRYKNAQGKWAAFKTEYRQDNAGDRRQAELLARRQSQKEGLQNTPTGTGTFESWVEPWLHDVYAGSETTTYDIFFRTWKHWQRYFKEIGITDPNQINREHARSYRDWRLPKGVKINTIIGEIKFAAIMMEEAKNRRYISDNPLRKLGLKKTPTEGRIPWTDEQLALVYKNLQRPRTADWMKVSFILGLYQASRLRQCQVPLTGINFGKEPSIFYPKSIMKGKKKDHLQHIDARAVKLLKPIYQKRIKEGHTTISTQPPMPSLLWRKWLDEISPDLKKISHHGLRSTWITQAALSGKVPEAAARAFVGHDDGEVHRIYIRIRPSQIAHFPALMSLPSFSV